MKKKSKAIQMTQKARQQIVKSKRVKPAPIERKPTDKVIAMILDAKEDEIIASEMAGKLVNKIGYQVVAKQEDKEKGVKKGDVLYEDLTYVGYKELARATIKFRFNEPKEVYMPDEKTWVVRIEAVNTETDENAWGGAEVGKNYTSGHFNSFAYRQAIVKAQRNALKQLIPLSKKMMMFQTYLKTKQGKKLIETVVADAETTRALLPELSEQNAILKGIFAKSHDLGLDNKKIHQFLKDQYKTDHLKDLPPKILREIKQALIDCGNNPSRLADLKLKLTEVVVKGGENE